MQLTAQEKAQAYYQANKQKYHERYLRYKAERDSDPDKKKAKQAVNRAWRLRWKAEHPELYLERKRRYAKAQTAKAKQDPEAIEALRAKRREARAKWMAKMRMERPDEFASYRKTEEYRQWRNEWQRKNRERKPSVRLAQAIRNTMNAALRGRYRACSYIEAIGCTTIELMHHLESQFDPEMNWKLYGHGFGKWSVDHIRPLASFNLDDPGQQRQAFHYSNLRPMWFEENCAKSSKHNGEKCFHSFPRG